MTAETSDDFNGILAPSDHFSTGSVTVGGTTFDSSGIAFSIDTSYNPTCGASFFSGQSPTVAPSDVLVTTSGTCAISFDFGSYISDQMHR